MLISAFYIQDYIKRLNNIINICTQNADIVAIKRKVYDLLIDIYVALEEIYCTFNDGHAYAIKKQINILHSNIYETEEIEVIVDVINKIILLLRELHYENNTMYDFSMAAKNYAFQYNNNMSISLYEAFKAFDTTINNNILDTRCLDVKTLKQFKEAFPNSDTYAISKNNGYSYKELFTKTISGAMEGSRITNDAFDIVICKPLISYEAIMIGNQLPYYNKKERTELINLTKYVRTNGVIFFIIPYYRLYKDIQIFLSKNYKNIQVRRTDSFNEDKTIMIIAQKKDNKELDTDTLSYLRKFNNKDKIPNYSEPLTKYNIPADKLPIDVFRGSVVNDDELSYMLETTNNYKEFFNSQKVEKLSETTKKPLLPFNIGQIGLVLTSGCLDGIVDEKNGYYHMIKGRVVKKKDTIQTVNDQGHIENEETVVNKVEINVLLPDGTLKTLS